MGQKVKPRGFRVGITEDWESRWYCHKKDFPQLVIEDEKIRRYFKGKYSYAAIPKIEIERAGGAVKIFVHTARPGIVIGRKGAEVDRFRADLEQLTGKAVNVNIVEVQQPELNAQLVAENVAEQLCRRAGFRRTMKRAIEMATERGAKGIKLQVAGRLGGAEMARTQKTSFGSVPLQTLRAEIRYGFAEAKTTYGVIGVKVWIYTGDYSKDDDSAVNAKKGKVQKAAQG